MMVETILESSQDFGMSNGSLPQWKRELLQRRLSRSRPCAAPAPPPPPPPPPPPADEDEELRYGPGIVKRLKSRYLSLALRDAPRRRPSVLRRAASLELLLDERPPPAPRARARPASLAAPAAPEPRAPAPRRDCVKRARSVDALSRLDARDEAPAPAPALAPPAPAARAPRPPRRPPPLLRAAERPPPDVVRSTLRKFESAPARRAAPAARVSAVLRTLEPRRSLTPEAPERTPSPLETLDPPPTSSPPPAPIEPPPTEPPPAFPTERSPPVPTDRSSPVPTEPPIPTAPYPTHADPSPAPSAAESEPPSPPRSPAPTIPPTVAFEPKIASSPSATPTPKITVQTVRTGRSPSSPTPPPRPASPPSTDEVEGCAASAPARRVSRAALEEIARAGSSVRYAFTSPRAAEQLPPLAATNPVLARGLRRVGVIRPMPVEPPPPQSPERATLLNGHSTPEPGSLSRIGAAGIERAWSGSAVKKLDAARPSPVRDTPDRKPSWLRSAGARPRAPPAAATSVVFNFSDRKEVPDYIENDGIILRASRRNRIKAGEPGVVVLRPEALTVDTDSEAEELDAGPPSPCDVRFVNDNVLINGKSSMPGKPNKDRIAKLKLQFDDSLTRTFEYPSETSLCEDSPPCPEVPAAPAAAATPATPAAPAPADNSALLADNTHIASAALCRYTPSKTCAAAFPLGLAPRPAPAPAPAPAAAHAPPPAMNGSQSPDGRREGEGEEEAEGDARPCGADAAKSWSDARAQHTDLLF